VGHPGDLAEVHRQLVEQHERGLPGEQLRDRVRAGGAVLLVAGANPLVSSATGKGIGQLAPWRSREQPVLQLAPVRRVGAFSPSNAPIRTAPGAGTSFESTNSATLPTPAIPFAAWASAINPWVLPPPKEVSSRKTAAASPPVPLRRASTLWSRLRRPRVG
jgi:hypothetical protein